MTDFHSHFGDMSRTECFTSYTNIPTNILSMPVLHLHDNEIEKYTYLPCQSHLLIIVKKKNSPKMAQKIRPKNVPTVHGSNGSVLDFLIFPFGDAQ